MVAQANFERPVERFGTGHVINEPVSVPGAWDFEMESIKPTIRERMSPRDLGGIATATTAEKQDIAEPDNVVRPAAVKPIDERVF